ncbi:MAG: OadG family protein [Ignavibacteriaceae bacterium]|nr:OadG family protein [Ignavibacteriaceae bacterium]
MLLLQTQQAITDTLSKTGKSEFFKQVDPYGLGMTVIGYVIVFIALLLLYLVFYNISKVLTLKLRRLLRREGIIDKEKKDISIPGEVNAAIAMALHLYFQEVHDEETAILTINRASKIYSPWSSKIYGLRQHPR